MLSINFLYLLLLSCTFVYFLQRSSTFCRQTHDCEREPHFVCGGHWRELVGMQLPTSGSIRKTSGPRLAYVAWHAFTTLSCTCRRHRRCTSCGTLRVTTTRRPLCSCLMISPSMRSSSRSVKRRIAGAIGSVCPCTDPKGAE